MDQFINDLMKLLDVDNSLCWVIILFDILAIFYLVFCSFYRITKTVKITGWVWVGILFTSNLGVMLYKPDLYSLLCLTFTVMIMMAIVSVVLPSTEDQVHRVDSKEVVAKAKKDVKIGSYVVRELTNGYFSFELYDEKDVLLANSHYCYKDVDAAKDGAIVCRRNGEVASIEDRTLYWIREMNHPKFVIYKEDNKYYYKLNVDKEFTILESESFNHYDSCKKEMEKAINAAKTHDVYVSIEKLSAKESLKYEGKLYVEKEETAQSVVLDKDSKTTKIEESDINEANQILLKIPVRKELSDSYKELSTTQKKYFDRIMKYAESKSQITVEKSKFETFFKYKNIMVMTLRISSNKTVAGFPLMDYTVKSQLAALSTKLREPLTLIKVKNDDLFETVINTFEIKYKLVADLLENKKKSSKSSTDKNSIEEEKGDK